MHSRAPALSHILVSYKARNIHELEVSGPWGEGRGGGGFASACDMAGGNARSFIHEYAKRMPPWVLQMPLSSHDF